MVARTIKVRESTFSHWFDSFVGVEDMVSYYSQHHDWNEAKGFLWCELIEAQEILDSNPVFFDSCKDTVQFIDSLFHFLVQN